jgi:hypothetical protein
VSQVARYLAAWVVPAIAVPLALPWLELIRLEGNFPYWIVTLQIVLWPTWLALIDDKHYMPVLLSIPLFWYSVLGNVLIYSAVGLAFWLTKDRYTWIRYVLVGFWLLVFAWLLNVHRLAL